MTINEQTHLLIKAAAREGNVILFNALLPFEDKSQWISGTLLNDIVLGKEQDMLKVEWAQYFTQRQICRAYLFACSINDYKISKQKRKMSKKLYKMIEEKELLLQVFEEQVFKNPAQYNGYLVRKIIKKFCEQGISTNWGKLKMLYIEKELVEQLAAVTPKSKESMNPFEIINAIEGYRDANNAKKVLRIISNEKINWHEEFVQSRNVCKVINLESGMTPLDYAKTFTGEVADAVVETIEEICSNRK